jgi:hypothetical protein
LFAIRARIRVTAQPTAVTTISAKIMYFILISLKKRLRKLKYIPETAINKAKIAEIASTQHRNAAAG